jgi:hypothetical protein
MEKQEEGEEELQVTGCRFQGKARSIFAVFNALKLVT